MNQLPAQLGFRMPAEWEPHEAVWLAWPYDKISFGSLNEPDEVMNPNRLPAVEKVYEQIISELAASERVELLVLDATKHKTAPGVRLHEVQYADVWTRDYLPSFITDGKTVAAVKWNYDAYGAKFPELFKDTAVWPQVSMKTGMQTFEPGIILETGAIEVNGQGTLLTTAQCLLQSSRNSGMDKEKMEHYLRSYLGATNIIWLERGLTNDHTDGHIDELARFVSSKKIVCAYEENPDDENYTILDNNYQALLKATDQDGNPFEVIKLPMPHMTYRDGNKAPVSYANFYIGNTVVLAATFRDPNDEKALAILQECFPGRRVVGIDCSEIIYGGGAIHCMTQQQPRA